jgi:hypothetical protein
VCVCVCVCELKTTNDWVIWRKDSRKGDEDLMSYLTRWGGRSSEAEPCEDKKNRRERLVKRCPCREELRRGEGGGTGEMQDRI